MRHLSAKIQPRRDDKILICLHTEEHVIARIFALKHNIPLFCLLHDAWQEYHAEGIRKTLKMSEHIFAVSENLLSLGRRHGAASGSVLPPIGEGFIGNNMPPPSNHEGLVVGMAGSLDREYVELGLRIGSRVIVISNESMGYSSSDRVKIVTRFDRNYDAIKYLSRHCHCLVLKMPPKSSDPYNALAFPSRLIDYCQSGLPIVICAPRASNVGIWAKKHEWFCYIDSPSDYDGIKKIQKYLVNEVNWTREKARSFRIAESEFHPERIHEMFERNI